MGPVVVSSSSRQFVLQPQLLIFHLTLFYFCVISLYYQVQIFCKGLPRYLNNLMFINLFHTGTAITFLFETLDLIQKNISKKFSILKRMVIFINKITYNPFKMPLVL